MRPSCSCSWQSFCDCKGLSIELSLVVEAVVFANEPRSPILFSGTGQIIGHFTPKSFLSVSDQLVAALHHLITGLLECGPLQCQVLQHMTVHNVDLQV